MKLAFEGRLSPREKSGRDSSVATEGNPVRLASEDSSCRSTASEQYKFVIKEGEAWSVDSLRECTAKLGPKGSEYITPARE